MQGAGRDQTGPPKEENAPNPSSIPQPWPLAATTLGGATLTPSPRSKGCSARKPAATLPRRCSRRHGSSRRRRSSTDQHAHVGRLDQ